RIGSRSDGVWGLYKGILDEIRIYNRELSQTEIQTDMGSGQPTYSISGYIKDVSSVAVSGVTVTLNGSVSVTTTTAGDGSYTFRGLSFGNYTVTPTKTNWSFAPTSLSYTNLTSTQTNQNIVGTENQPTTYSVSGYIKDSSGTIITSVTVTLTTSDGLTVIASTTTDSNGYYFFANLVAGNYNVNPAKTGYTFVFINITIVNVNITNQDIASTGGSSGGPNNTYSINGYIKDNSSSAIVAVNVALTGTVSLNTTTDVNGYYQFTNLSNGAYVVTPTKDSWSFYTSSLTYATLTSTQTDQNFIGTPIAPVITTYSISGSISNSTGTMISGVTVALSGSSTTIATTANDGSYSFTNLDAGDYTLTPTKAGYTFNPVTLSAVLVSSNLTGKNFTAIQVIDNPPSVSITVPGNRQVVNGNLNVKVEATDDNGISKIEYYIDNVLKHTDATADKLHWHWDTSAETDGEHSLKVVAYDTINQTASDQITAIAHQKPADVNIIGELKPVEPIVEPGSGKKAKIKFKVDLPANQKQLAGDKAKVHVRITIHNVRGTLVKTLVDEDMPIGESETLWNGKNFAEEVAASGAYIVRIQAGDFKDMKKIVVVK
ncbi:MAG: DUF2012 domain-containing protein, partial [Elusimicrobia bacterium]|nr:DUF2012 domain-containing protein [Elusimicrobiota bacterium]